MSFLRRNRRPLVGAAIGALGGALYTHFIGCRTGTCLISSNIWVSTFYWGFVGGIALMPTASPRERPARTEEADSA